MLKDNMERIYAAPYYAAIARKALAQTKHGEMEEDILIEYGPTTEELEFRTKYRNH